MLPVGFVSVSREHSACVRRPIPCNSRLCLDYIILYIYNHIYVLFFRLKLVQL